MISWVNTAKVNYLLVISGLLNNFLLDKKKSESLNTYTELPVYYRCIPCK